eukprot:g236.t1
MTDPTLQVLKHEAPVPKNEASVPKNKVSFNNKTGVVVHDKSVTIDPSLFLELLVLEYMGDIHLSGTRHYCMSQDISKGISLSLPIQLSSANTTNNDLVNSFFINLDSQRIYQAIIACLEESYRSLTLKKAKMIISEQRKNKVSSEQCKKNKGSEIKCQDTKSASIPSHRSQNTTAFDRIVPLSVVISCSSLTKKRPKGRANTALWIRIFVYCLLWHAVRVQENDNKELIRTNTQGCNNFQKGNKQKSEDPKEFETIIDAKDLFLKLISRYESTSDNDEDHNRQLSGNICAPNIDETLHNFELILRSSDWWKSANSINTFDSKAPSDNKGDVIKTTAWWTKNYPFTTNLVMSSDSKSTMTRNAEGLLLDKDRKGNINTTVRGHLATGSSRKDTDTLNPPTTKSLDTLRLTSKAEWIDTVEELEGVMSTIKTLQETYLKANKIFPIAFDTEWADYNRNDHYNREEERTSVTSGQHVQERKFENEILQIAANDSGTGLSRTTSSRESVLQESSTVCALLQIAVPCSVPEEKDNFEDSPSYYVWIIDTFKVFLFLNTKPQRKEIDDTNQKLTSSATQYGEAILRLLSLIFTPTEHIQPLAFAIKGDVQMLNHLLTHLQQTLSAITSEEKEFILSGASIRDIQREFMKIISFVNCNSRTASNNRKKRNETPPSLAHLVRKLLYKSLDKTEQCSDWKRRPLTPKQFHYAALDAEVLLLLYKKIDELNSRRSYLKKNQ